MDFPKRSKVKLLKSPDDDDSLKQLLPHNCLFYILPPLIDVSLKDFDELAIERLKLLRIVEQAGVKFPKILSDDWKKHIVDELNIAGLKYFVRLLKGNGNSEQDMSARRRDYLSHFILRFAYCRSEDMRRWFIAREMELFRFKFSALSSSEVKDFVEIYEMGYRPINEDQKNELRQELQSTVVSNIDGIDFYKVSFLAVLDLVRQRRCFLKSGFAFVSSMDFSSIIGNHHQKFIDKGLMSHLKVLPEFENDERIVGVIKGLHNSYLGKDYTVNKDADVPIESLDQLSLKSYPPCMRRCHDSLRTTHHLKYHGRLQYGLFLKGIGVTLEDSLRFWREEFIKHMEPDKFDKTYLYGIRYNYGKEGKRNNWVPWSCMKVINGGNGGAQDVCGCPFKIWDPIEMKSKMIGYGLNQVNVQDVISLASKGHFQLACGRYFELTHDDKLEEGVNHPNAYFENSQILMGNRESKKTTQSLEQSLINQRKQNQASQKQAFNRKREARNKAEHEFDDALWELSQREEELLAELKAKEQKKEVMMMEVSEIESMQWDE